MWLSHRLVFLSFLFTLRKSEIFTHFVRMGISDFYSVLEDNCPGTMVTAKLANLAGISVAIDISIFLNKFVKTAGAEKWISTFIILLCTIKKNGLKPVCIFDGPNPPIEKKAEQDRRRSEAAKTAEKLAYGRSLLKKIEKNLPKELDEDTLEDVKTFIGKKRVDTTNYADVYDVVEALRENIARKTIQNLPILPIYTKMAKEIIEIMGFAWFQAKGEAEGLCADLCKKGLVDAALSEDTDLMAYGTPFLLSKLDISNETVRVVSHEAILESLELNHDEFLDMCILLECDYNKRIKGYVPDGKKRKKPAPIGAKGAYLMIKEYRRLEDAERYIEDIEPLNYRRCREIFNESTGEADMVIPHNEPIDGERLLDFLSKYNVKLSVDYIMKSWKAPEMVYEDDEDVYSDDEEAFEMENA